MIMVCLSDIVCKFPSGDSLVLQRRLLLAWAVRTRSQSPIHHGMQWTYFGYACVLHHHKPSNTLQQKRQ